MTTIETKAGCDIRVTPDGLSLGNCGCEVSTALTPDEARQVAAALVPATEATPVADWLTEQHAAPHVHWAMKTGGQWTRDEIAAVLERTDSDTSHGDEVTYTDMADAVVTHLNTHHPKPAPYDQGGWPEGWPTVANMEARAVTAEHARNAAVARAEAAEKRAERHASGATAANLERDQAYAEKVEQYNRAETAESELAAMAERADDLRYSRDAAVARAEAAERVLRERDEQEDDATRAACERAEALDKQAHDWAGMYKVAAERAEQAESERDGWRENAEHWSSMIAGLEARAEKAEELAAQRAETVRRLRDAHSNLIARHRRLTDQSDKPTPVASRADVEKAVRIVLCGDPDALSVRAQSVTDAVWALVSGTDPAVHVVRESDIAAVKVEQVRDEVWHADGTLVAWTGESAEDVRGQQDSARRNFIHREAVARAIEAEQPVDQVEELASQIETATRDAIRDLVDSLTSVAPGLIAPDVEGLLDQTIRDGSQKLARRVLGQEADQ